MIVLLYCVAVLLVLGGGAAALFGADTIRNESGAAWLQAGAVCAASGVLLMALAAILAELRRIRRSLADMAIEVQDLPTAAAPPPPPPPPYGAPVAIAAGAGAVLGGAALAAAMAAQPAGTATSEPPAEAQDDLRELGDPDDHIASAGLPDPTPGIPEQAGGAPALDEPIDRDEPIDLDDPELANPDPDLFDDLAAGAGPDSTPHLVRTYASGGNTYLMYSDGSIEAEMDDGRHRFPSMAALRHFVETGEGGERIGPTDQPSSLPPTAPTANA